MRIEPLCCVLAVLCLLIKFWQVYVLPLTNANLDIELPELLRRYKYIVGSSHRRLAWYSRDTMDEANKGFGIP